MARLLWQNCEDAFEAHWKSLGKAAYCYKLVDAAEVKGRTGVIGLARAQPSDYIVVNGSTHFAEVKSTQNKTSFPFNLLRAKQSSAARMVMAAGGEYLIYCYSAARKTWFRFPYSLVQNATKKSIPWSDLKEYIWNPKP